jgi:hypothetical protein
MFEAAAQTMGLSDTAGTSSAKSSNDPIFLRYFLIHRTPEIEYYLKMNGANSTR